MLVATQMTYRHIEDAPLNISKAVSEISTRIKTLAPRRKYLFLESLSAHCSTVQIENITDGLHAWLGNAHQQGVQYEYNLILKEIDWWVAQCEATVERLLREHFAGRRS